MGDFIQIEKKGRVAILRMNRPDTMNALSTREDCEDFVAALEDLNDDQSISAAILTGNGRAFCAGGDLRSMRDRNGIGPLDQPDSTRSNYRRGVQRVAKALLDTEVPMIAAINGAAIGLGCDLACLCDIRLAAETAKFAASFVKIGIVPGDGGAWALSQIVGYSTAAELFLTGDGFGADRALAMGLVSRLAAPDELLDQAMAIAERIAANPPRALRLTKRLLRDAQNMRMSDVLELSAAFQAIAHETADHREAIDAFLEKRPPIFSGA